MEIFFVFLFIFLIYFKFLKTRCPECKSFDYKKKSKKLLNKYKNESQSNTTCASGNKVYREYWNHGEYVFVYNTVFLCRKCGNEWFKETTETKSIPRKLVKKVRIS